MNLNRRTSYNIKENFLIELMKDRGVLPASQEEQERFFHPVKENELKPELLDNMEEGFQLLMKHMHDSKILLVVDPD